MHSPGFTYNPDRRILRFRRWSRKRYAAFVSLHNTVTMGCLAANVADRLQGKQSSLHSSERISSSPYKLMENLPDDMVADNDISLAINICEAVMLPVVLATSAPGEYYALSIIKDISEKTEDTAFILRHLLSFAFLNWKLKVGNLTLADLKSTPFWKRELKNNSLCSPCLRV